MKQVGIRVRTEDYKILNTDKSSEKDYGIKKPKTGSANGVTVASKVVDIFTIKIETATTIV
jgi:hypothetical protein